LVKKSNVTGINFTDKAILILQKLEYIDGNKKSINRNLSHFISALVCEYVDFSRGLNKNQIEIQVLKKNLVHLQNTRNSLEKDIMKIASDIRQLQDIENSLEVVE
jgi:hypothetical protein